MEYKEVEAVNKEVIVNIKDVINLKELEAYMDSWFTASTFQVIQANIRNNGECNAVLQFLDAVKKKPDTFPKLMAALKQTEQIFVYEKFMKAVKKTFQKRHARLEKVLSLIKDEEKEQLGEPEDVHVSHFASSSVSNLTGQGAVQQNSGSHPSNNTPAANESSQVIYERKGHEPYGGNQVHQTFERRERYEPLRDQVPHTLGNRVHSAGEIKEQTYPITRSVSSTVLDSNIPGATGQSKSPEVELLDFSRKHGLTVEDLQRLVNQLQTKEAADIPHHHQNKGIEERHYVQTDDNNLNKIQDVKADPSKNFNISVQQTSDSPGIEERHYVQTDDNNLNRNQDVKADPSKNFNISVQQTCDSPGIERDISGIQLLQKRAERSDDQLTSQTNQKSLPSIENELPEAIRANGDQSSTQPNPEKDAQMLHDPVHQFDTKQAASEKNIPVKKEQTAGNGAHKSYISGELYDDRGQICNQSTEHYSGVNTDTQSALVNPSGSGNMPLLSQILLDSRNEDRIEDPSVRPEGVVNVSPREITTFEKNTTAAAVTVVPPSVSMSSSEITADISIEEQEAESNLTSNDSLDVNVLMQATDQETGVSDSENVTCDMKGKTEK